MGDKKKAKATLAEAGPAKHASSEDAMLHRLLQPEIDAGLAKTETP
jgi:hypothetical protein